MSFKPDPLVTPAALEPAVRHVFELSAVKIRRLQKRWRPDLGAPVFTVRGRYTTRGWTEWTQGFQYGSALLQYEATGDSAFLEMGRRGTLEAMAGHVSHTGVHDHGFNNISTYGTLLRLIRDGRAPEEDAGICQLALKVSGAVQASRWTGLADGTGFIHSFNGAHSLFVDTLRSLRVLAVAHRMGHVLMGEQDRRISLARRLAHHAMNTARYNVYYGEGRDAYDVSGRTAHEAVFNVVSGVFRCPNSQQGWSPFTTWTRGLAWAVCGFSELLEFIADTGALEEETSATEDLVRVLLRAARVTADFYLEHCCADGIPPWDTGAPRLGAWGDYTTAVSDPFNLWEPVDSSAAVIAAQGFLRLARVLSGEAVHGGHAWVRADAAGAMRYRQAGLTLARTLFHEPYLSMKPDHEGLILHSVYHRPNGWDHVAPGQKVPNGESSMWGDYHARELALMILREAQGGPRPSFYGWLPAR